MLAGFDPGTARQVAPVVVALPDDDQPWSDLIERGAAEARREGGTMIVALERPLARALLSLLAGKRWDLRQAPSIAEIEAELREHSMRLEQTFILWPSARTPRIATPRRARRPLIWAQRSGVLGGGGSRLWARVAARSPLFTPLALLLHPGLALVARPARDRDA
jgi:hypothetical protein